MEAFEVLRDPVRRRILELLAEGEHASGDVVAVIAEEFGLSQPAVSQHLKVLREGGFADVRAEGPRRLYSLRPTTLADAEAWLSGLRRTWEVHLDALDLEVRRGRRRSTEGS